MRKLSLPIVLLFFIFSSQCQDGSLKAESSINSSENVETIEASAPHLYVFTLIREDDKLVTKGLTVTKFGNIIACKRHETTLRALAAQNSITNYYAVCYE